MQPPLCGTEGEGPVVMFRKRTLEALGDLVCGNLGSDDPNAASEPKYFPYRSSTYITDFLPSSARTGCMTAPLGTAGWPAFLKRCSPSRMMVPPSHRSPSADSSTIS